MAAQCDPAGFDLVVNATPLGMNPGDPLPVDVTRLAPRTFVGEVVMKQEITPLLRAERERGCPIQVGTDMLVRADPAVPGVLRLRQGDARRAPRRGDAGTKAHAIAVNAREPAHQEARHG